MAPKVSIVLTSFNQEAFLRNSIDSILAQDYTDYELVIVDDYSSDQSWEIIGEYANNYPFIRAIRSERNTNLILQKPLIDSLQGEYVAIAHSDDAWLHSKLGKQVIYMENHPECGACFTKVRLIDEDGKPYKGTESYLTNAFNVENRNRHEWLRYLLFNNCPFCHPSLLQRKDIYYEPNTLPYGLASIPDYYRWITLAMHHEIYVYPEALSYFRVRRHEANTSGESYEKRNRQAYELWKALHLYTKITDATELLTIFPSANKYCVGEEIHTQFALARILMEEGHLPMHWQLGQDILFSLLQKEKDRLIIERLYGYTYTSFVRETTKRDIYNLVPLESFQTSSVYYDIGEGFSEQYRIEQRNYITAAGAFHVSFHIHAKSSYFIKALRFDPDEGRLRCYIIDQATLNGEPIHLVASNAIFESGWDIFYTLDPQYYITTESTQELFLEIDGHTKLTDAATIENRMTQLLQNRDERQDMQHRIEELTKETKRIWDERSERDKQIEILSIENEKLRQNLVESRIKTDMYRQKCAHLKEETTRLKTQLTISKNTYTQLKTEQAEILKYQRHHRLHAAFHILLKK